MTRFTASGRTFDDPRRLRHETEELYIKGPEEMATAARARGYQYMALTDHSRSLTITNGLSLERLEEAQRLVHQLNEQLAPFVILLGTEMDFKVDKLSSTFVFNNPNQTSACGCGESVQLTPAADPAGADAH